MGNKLGVKTINPGSVLDRVISQSSNDDDCLLYKLANYKQTGELIDAYNLGGPAEVESLIREQFGMLMYREGKGQIISRTEYLRWKFRNTKHVVIPVEPTSSFDPLGKWEDHEACWQMQYRGSLGETLLHLLIICDTKMTTRLARILLKCYPKLAVDVVEGEEYLGASALHLAIAYNNNELVNLLVKCGSPIEQRAIGSFFLPRDQQRIPPSKTTDYEGLAYLGEYPLAWAACVNNETVYNLLLDHGADPDKQDSFGNMILHMVVYTDQLGMYGYALRHPQKCASNDIVNNQGLTPLTLACRLGRASVFREMLELSCKEFWRYSNITCSGYPLNALDTIFPDGRTNWNSALFMILAGSKEEHLDMLDGGIIQRLLEEKWKTFAQRQFLKRIIIAAIHLIAMSVAVYLRPKERSKSLLVWEDGRDLVRMIFEVGTVFGCLSFVIVQQGNEIRNQGLFAFLKQLPHAPPKALFLIANLLILSCIPFRLSGDVPTEESLLAFTMVFSWFFMMFFAGAIKLTGPFVTMVYSMITGDMLTFSIIYAIFLLAFSQAFFYLYKGHPDPSGTIFTEFDATWMAMYQMTLGAYSYEDLSKLAYPNAAKTVFIIFMIMVPILLLNMLIAMMGNTYSLVIERSEKEWVKQWAKIVVTLERAVSQSDAKQYIQEYSIKLSGTDLSDEVRGVVVIKSKSKTRAKQRKGAVTNWKRVGKVTITALKRRKMTGEEMRQIMWGHRNSLATPQNATPRQSMQVDAFDQTKINEGLSAIDKLAAKSSILPHSNGVPPPDYNAVVEMTRSKRRIGLRPKILIFSEKMDLIRVSLDSEDSDEEVTTDTLQKKGSKKSALAGEDLQLNTGGKISTPAVKVPETKETSSSLPAPSTDKASKPENNKKNPEPSATPKNQANDTQSPPVVSEGPSTAPDTSPPKSRGPAASKARPKSAKPGNGSRGGSGAGGKTSTAKPTTGMTGSVACPENIVEEEEGEGEEVPESDSTGEKKRRPLTALDKWTDKEQVENMSKLVAWDRPEDDI